MTDPVLSRLWPLLVWITVVLLLTACGPVRLADRIDGPVGLSRRLAVAECRDGAVQWTQRPEAQVRGFATGFFLPVVGIAVDASVQRREAREWFSRCMTDRGYVVVVGRE